MIDRFILIFRPKLSSCNRICFFVLWMSFVLCSSLFSEGPKVTNETRVSGSVIFSEFLPFPGAQAGFGIYLSQAINIRGEISYIPFGLSVVISPEYNFVGLKGQVLIPYLGIRAGGGMVVGFLAGGIAPMLDAGVFGGLKYVISIEPLNRFYLFLEPQLKVLSLPPVVGLFFSIQLGISVMNI